MIPMSWPELYEAKQKALEISAEIEKLLKELQKSLDNHKNQLKAKSSFLKRHNSRNKY